MYFTFAQTYRHLLFESGRPVRLSSVIHCVKVVIQFLFFSSASSAKSKKYISVMVYHG